MSWFRRGPRHPEEDLSAYIDGHLSEAARREVESHLDACEACRLLLAELRAAKSALAALPRLEPRRSFVLGPEHAAPARDSGRRPAALAFAPAVALTVFVALLAVDLSGAVEEGDGGRAVLPAFEKAGSQAPNESLRMPEAPAAQDAAGSRPEGEASPLAAPQPAAAAPSPAAASEPGRAAGQEARDGTHVLGREEGSGETVLRVLEFLAAAAFAASVAVALRSRRKGSRP